MQRQSDPRGHRCTHRIASWGVTRCGGDVRSGVRSLVSRRYRGQRITVRIDDITRRHVHERQVAHAADKAVYVVPRAVVEEFIMVLSELLRELIQGICTFNLKK